jgi:type III pantothenate kinase
MDKRPMLLLIDAGNTRVKWACVAEHTDNDSLCFPVMWEAMGSVSHQGIEQLLLSVQHYSVVRCLMSNVAGDALHQEIVQLLSISFPDLHIQSFKALDQCAGVRNHYVHPTKLGSDRFASVIAAHAQFPEKDLIVATCGTATTVDAVSAKGDFLGGMILPGLQLMASSLAKNTAQLPHIEQHAQMPDLLARDTDQAIASGCVHAQIGAMLCAVKNLEQTTGTPVQLIISGGAAAYLIPQLKQFEDLHWRHAENLVLTGLWIVSHATRVTQASIL